MSVNGPPIKSRCEHSSLPIRSPYSCVFVNMCVLGIRRCPCMERYTYEFKEAVAEQISVSCDKMAAGHFILAAGQNKMTLD